MRKLLSTALILSLMTGSAAIGVSGQTPGQKAPAVAAKVEGSAPRASGAAALFSLLPASDLLAVIDVGRAFNELLPKVAELNAGGLEKLARDIQAFTEKTGIDPSKVQSAVVGLNLSGLQANGAIILEGIELDDKKVEAAMAEFKTEYKKSEYNGKRIFTVISKVKAPSAGPVSVKTDETAFVAIGNKLALGDLAVIKNVIDIDSGAAKGGVDPGMISAIEETRSSSLIRFALNIPENIRQEASSQGDLFKSVSTIKMILGSFDVASDFSLSLDAIMRTASQSEAGELETGLKGLVSLVRGFFGGSDPKTDVFGQLLDQVKIGSKLSDVSLSINLPRSLFDQLFKKTETAEKK